MQNRFDFILDHVMHRDGPHESFSNKPLDLLCYLALRAIYDKDNMIAEITRMEVRRVKAAYGSAIRDYNFMALSVKDDAEKYKRTEALRAEIYRAHRDGAQRDEEWWSALATKLADAIGGIGGK